MMPLRHCHKGIDHGLNSTVEWMGCGLTERQRHGIFGA
jgi:hypothetical protein